MSRLLALALLVAGLLALASCRPASPPAPTPPSAAAVEPAAASAPVPPPASSTASSALPVLPDASAARETFTDLVERVAALKGSGELRLPPGDFVLAPKPMEDAACVPCPGDDWQEIHPPTTVGLRVSGRGVRIVGAGSGSTVIRTRSGVGILFEDCEDCSIAGVTITDGERDPSDAATNAAISVRQSSVRISDCVLQDNVGADFNVQQAFVGISGVVVREGGRAVVERCRIRRQSWDGVSVVRGGEAEIRDVVIDGVDKAVGMVVGGGRGPGIRAALGGRALVDGVLIARHAGGLAVHAGSSVTGGDLVVEDSSAGGLLVDGRTDAPAELNVDGALLNRTAACGVMVRPEQGVQGRLEGIRLVLTGSGQAASQPCVGKALEVRGSLAVEDAAAWLTGGPGGAPGDLAAPEFQAATKPLLARLAARPATAESVYVATN